MPKHRHEKPSVDAARDVVLGINVGDLVHYDTGTPGLDDARTYKVRRLTPSYVEAMVEVEGFCGETPSHNFFKAA